MTPTNNDVVASEPATPAKQPITVITLNRADGSVIATPIRQRVSIPVHKEFSALVRKLNRDNAELTKETKTILQMSSIKDDGERNKFYSDNIDEILDKMSINEDREELEFTFNMTAIRIIIDDRDLPQEVQAMIRSAIDSPFWQGQEDYTAIKDAVAWFRGERMGLG
ncbi:MAG: hypothetical protein ABIR47_07420 [Candidatus Kapaibacterium sp.]